MTIRIVIADDHHIVRERLRMFLERDPELAIIGEAANGAEAVACAQELQPDVIVMDLLMPVMDGITATSIIRSALPETEVLALTSVLESSSVVRAIRAGVIGYLLKDTHATELRKAIKAAAAHQVQLSPQATHYLMHEVQDAASTTPLTEREMDVLRLLAQGQSNKEIAWQLDLVEDTVKTHVLHILSKLGVQSRTQATLHAMRMAARDGSKLNLTRATEQDNPFRQIMEGVILPGEHVLILGATTSSAIHLAAQRAGQTGSLLILEPEITHFQDALEQISTIKYQLGYENWRFVQTELDDLRTDPTVLARLLTECSVADVSRSLAMQAQLDEQRTAIPLVPDHTIDVAILDMTMNRLPQEKVGGMLAETRRVLRLDGRLVVSVLLADEPTTEALPVLTHGPALRYVPTETNVVPTLGTVGYHGVRYLWRSDLPISVLNGIEFRAFILEAYNSKPSDHRDAGQAVIYRGPWKEVVDDEGIRYSRGYRTAVSTRTYEMLQQAPYREEIFSIPCYMEIPTDRMPPFDVRTPQLLNPQMTRGTQSLFNTDENACCDACCPPNDTEEATHCEGDPAKFAQIRSGAVVLELGSGSGHDTALIARLSGETGRVIGIEPSESMRARARTHVARLGLDRVSFTDGTAHNLPLPDASVDILIGKSSLLAAADPKKAWTEVTRVLRPGGRFTVSDKVIGSRKTLDMESNNQNKGAVSRHWHDYYRNLREVGVSGLRIVNALPIEQHHGDTLYSITLSGRSQLVIPSVLMQVFSPHAYFNDVSRAMMAFLSSSHPANRECDFELLNIADPNVWNVVEFALRANGASEETLARDRVYVMANGQIIVHWKPVPPDTDTGNLTTLLQKSLSTI